MIKTALMRTFVFPNKSSLHIARKLWHISIGFSGIAAFFHFHMDARSLGWKILALAITAFGVETLRLRWELLNKIVCRLMAPFLRDSEVKSISGFPYYALGVGGALLLFPVQWSVLAISFLVFADPIASAFGVLYGKEKILPGKSLQGFAAGFCVSYFITFVYLSNEIGPSLKVFAFSILAGLIGALSELASAFGIDDNLTIPILSGLGLVILNQLITVM